jgi:uracil-DNA glycosylase family 4
MEPSELLELVRETEKQLRHLQTLGVEGIKISDLATLAHVRKQTPAVATPISRNEVKPIKTPEPVQSRVATREKVEGVLDSLFGDAVPAPQKIEASNETFEQIHLDVGDCTRCPLHRERTTIVHTEGNRKSRLMFVGEAPGADEDIQARPFVGRAGQLLTKIIEAIGLKREEVIIGNVNRCRPPGNRPPTPEEASMCKPFLLREIAIVQPEVIVVLGNTAMKNLLDTREGITKLRGRFQDYKGIKVMPTYHPAYLLRDPSKKRETWEDLKKVRDYLDSTSTSK